MPRKAKELGPERPLLIDPTVDDPAMHLALGDGGTIAELTERGRVTIGVLGLQRDRLVRKREVARIQLMHLIASANSATPCGEEPGGCPIEAGAVGPPQGHSHRLSRRRGPFLSMSKQLVREHLAH